MYYPRFGSMGGGELHALQTALALESLGEVTVVGEAIPTPEATLARYGIDTASLQRLDLTADLGVARRLLGSDWTYRRWKHPFVRLAHRRRIEQLLPDLFVNFEMDRPFAALGSAGVYFCFFPMSSPARNARGRFSVYHTVCDFVERICLGDPAVSIETYKAIVANSSFSAQWTEQLWHVDTQYIWPPCKDMGPAVVDKKPWILGVGRFHAPDGMEHSKSQDVMVDAFAKLHANELIPPDVELHLAGDLNGELRNQRLIDELRQRAAGFPVFFHPNATFDELRALYQQSSLFWMATGYGFDPEDFPGKQEHFGMVTVEALSAGAVPLARASGGSLEILDHTCGMLWQDIDELVAATAELLGDDERRRAMSSAAVRRAQLFGVEAYFEHVRHLARSLLSAAPDHVVRPL